MSLRRRLLLGLIAVTAVLVVANVALSSTVRAVLLDRVDQQLVDIASRPVFRVDRGRGPGGAGGPLSSSEPTLSEYFIAAGDPESGTLTRFASAFVDESEPQPRLDREQVLAHRGASRAGARPFTAPATQGGGSWRLVAFTSPGGFTTVIGISLDELAATTARLRLLQVSGALAVVGALGLVSWWMLRLGVDPIEDMAATADGIAAGDLSHRVEHPGPATEAGRLGIALNAMFDRIEESFHAREASEGRVRRFAADASHELRTPLTSIQGYAELWRAGGLRGDGELEDAMRRIEAEASRMGSLVEDLLLLARLDQRRPVEQATVHLDEIVADAVSDAQAVEPDRPIDADLQPVTVEGDEMALRQVVANLLANVRAHTPAGTAARVSVSSSDGLAYLEVADDGPGMAPEVAAQVFERFFRADASRGRATASTGLGLAIVAAVAEAHGGTAAVESTPATGTRFTVTLPAPPRK